MLPHPQGGPRGRVGCDPQFFDLWRRPVLTQQSAKNGCEHVARLDRPQLTGTVLPDLFGFSDRCFGRHGVSGSCWI